jgi:hypothetical protein
VCRETGTHGFVAETGGAIPSSTVTAIAARERFLLNMKRRVWAAAAEAGALLRHEVAGWYY